MLDYLADKIENTQDVSWASAKVKHAVVLCHMEVRPGKLVSSDPMRITKSYAQTVGLNQGSGGHSSNNNSISGKSKSFTCKFYWNGTCSHCSHDHTSGGRRKKHNCNSFYGTQSIEGMQGWKELVKKLNATMHCII